MQYRPGVISQHTELPSITQGFIYLVKYLPRGCLREQPQPGRQGRPEDHTSETHPGSRPTAPRFIKKNIKIKIRIIVHGKRSCCKILMLRCKKGRTSFTIRLHSQSTIQNRCKANPIAKSTSVSIFKIVTLTVPEVGCFRVLLQST